MKATKENNHQTQKLMIIKQIILICIMILIGQKVQQGHMNSYSKPPTMVQNC